MAYVIVSDSLLACLGQEKDLATRDYSILVSCDTRLWFTCFQLKGWQYNKFCIPIFTLSQDKIQGTITKIADGQKSNYLLVEQESTLHFT